MDRTLEACRANTGMTLVMAINYGARTEIVDAMAAIADKLLRREISLNEITEELVSDNMYTAGLPDPDLLIRTSGEMRISNFLLWQISYAEIWVTPTLWPEFDASHLAEAIRDYASRSRRFGGLREARESEV
jgi:undecaprenyl diphosphate synthase